MGVGLDDDAECVDHVWQLEELHLTLDGAAMASTCARCGAVSYEPSGSTDRPKL